jgi:PAS domain S-box-containing protein
LPLGWVLKLPDGVKVSVVSARSEQRREARELMDAMLAGFDDRVRSVVREALRRSGSFISVVSQLVDSARVEIENMWYRGDLGVADEHRMLRELEAIVGEIALEMPGGTPSGRRCILTATDELNGAINKRLLEEDGWTVRVVDPDAVVTQAQLALRQDRRLVLYVGDAAVARAELKSTIATLQALGSRVLIVVPGPWAQAGQWQQLGADACAEDARTMLLVARKLYSADASFSISEVAASLRVTPHTIRAWERRYRLPPPARDRSGQRTYTTDDVQLLLRISHAVTVHGHSLKLAALEAQGFVSDEVGDMGSLSGAAVESAAPTGHPWRRVADAIPELLILVDSDGTIVDCNIATARIRDTVREDLRGTRLTDLVIDYDRAKAARLYRPSPRRRDAWELRVRSRTGKQTIVAFDSRPVAADGARLLGLIGRTVSEEGAPVPQSA